MKICPFIDSRKPPAPENVHGGSNISYYNRWIIGGKRIGESVKKSGTA
jgi:hypothetical protein